MPRSLPSVLAMLMAALPSAAPAQDASSTFFVKDKGWTIMAGARGCDAVNRDLTEFNVAPVNALWLTRYQGQDPHTVVRVFYWPGVFEDDKPVTLKFRLLDGSSFDLEAMTTGDLIADSSYPLTPDNFKALETAGFVTIEIDGKPTVAFQTRGILDASQYLERCTATIKREP